MFLCEKIIAIHLPNKSQLFQNLPGHAKCFAPVAAIESNKQSRLCLAKIFLTIQNFSKFFYVSSISGC